MEQLSLFDDQIDELIPDRSEVPKVAQSGDIFQLGEHRLMCGDSTDHGCLQKLTGGGRRWIYVSQILPTA